MSVVGDQLDPLDSAVPISLTSVIFLNGVRFDPDDHMKLDKKQ